MAFSSDATCPIPTQDWRSIPAESQSNRRDPTTATKGPLIKVWETNSTIDAQNPAHRRLGMQGSSFARPQWEGMPSDQDVGRFLASNPQPHGGRESQGPVAPAKATVQDAIRREGDNLARYSTPAQQQQQQQFNHKGTGSQSPHPTHLSCRKTSSDGGLNGGVCPSPSSPLEPTLSGISMESDGAASPAWSTDSRASGACASGSGSGSGSGQMAPRYALREKVLRSASAASQSDGERHWCLLPSPLL